MSSSCLKCADPYPFSHFLSGAWSCLQQRRWLLYRWFCCWVLGRGIYIHIHAFFSPCSGLTKFYHNVSTVDSEISDLSSLILPCNEDLVGNWLSSAKSHVILQECKTNYSKEFDPWLTWLKTDIIGLGFIVLIFYLCKTLFFLFITKFSIFSVCDLLHSFFAARISSYAKPHFCC